MDGWWTTADLFAIQAIEHGVSVQELYKKLTNWSLPGCAQTDTMAWKMFVATLMDHVQKASGAPVSNSPRRRSLRGHRPVRRKLGFLGRRRRRNEMEYQNPGDAYGGTTVHTQPSFRDALSVYHSPIPPSAFQTMVLRPKGQPSQKRFTGW